MAQNKMKKQTSFINRFDDVKYLMLMAVTVFLCLSQLSYAQEIGGHGRRQHHGRHQQQQQQQQQMSCYQRVAVYGSEAEELYRLVSSKSAPRDMSEECSKPVWKVYAGRGSNQLVCFDRGDEFSLQSSSKRHSRFKCYKAINKEVSCLRDLFFDWTHNACGGNGIREVKPDRQK